MSATTIRLACLNALFFGSGCVALASQVVWARMFALGLGHEMPSILAVLFAFMAGMAMGSAALDGVISRSRQPGRWLAVLLLVVAVWAGLSGVLVPAAGAAAQRWIGLEASTPRHLGVALAVSFVVLAPATTAMGATLPAMEAFLSCQTRNRRCLGAVYGANTLGAVAGTVLAVHAWMPSLGLRHTGVLVAVIGLGCASCAWLLARATGPIAPQRSNNADASDPAFGAYVRLAAAGLLGIGYEIAGIRALSQVLENTIFTYAAALAVFLLGTSVGAALYQRFGSRSEMPRLSSRLLCGLAFSCGLGALAMKAAASLYPEVRRALGDEPAALIAAESSMALLVFGLPTLLMGALFSHWVQAAKGVRGGIGTAAAWNLLGGAAAPVAFGFILLPHLGLTGCAIAVGVGYLLLLEPAAVGRPWGVAAALAVNLLGLPFAGLDHPPGSAGLTVLDYRQGVMASVAVVQGWDSHRSLRVNNRFQMGGTAAADAEIRHAHIPLLLHPDPRRALFLGLGTGITFGAAAVHPNLEADGVELLPEVVQAMGWFSPQNRSSEWGTHLRVHTADARRFVRGTASRYDVIVADLFHPAMDGAGSLYTCEHFAAIRDRLQPGGLFCQWLPLHQLDEAMLRVITATFLSVFPDAEAWLLRLEVDVPVVGLMGRRGPAPVSLEPVEARLRPTPLADELRRLGLTDTLRLAGLFVAGPEDLSRFVGGAPLNTDDLPRVMFGAPAFSYEMHATPHDRLFALLAIHRGSRTSVPSWLQGEPVMQDRVARYIAARDVYLRGLVRDSPGRNEEAIVAYLESARLSEEFTAGYAQCLSIAARLASTRPGEAVELLRRLVAAQPAQAAGREMLRRLDGEKLQTDR